MRYQQSEPGEYYQSFNGELGGLWRRLGAPPNTLVGSGTVATGFDSASYYRVDVLKERDWVYTVHVYW